MNFNKKVMKTNYTVFIVFICFLSICTNSLNAQQLYFRAHTGAGNYNAPAIFPANGVADDYGPRRVTPNNWHGGIDYNAWTNSGNNAHGYMILAPQAGTIVDVNNLIGPNAPNAKSLTLDVGSYRYLFVHLFTNSTAWQLIENDSTIMAKRMLGLDNQDKWAIIMTINDTLRVIGQVNGFVEHNGDTLNVSNVITQYDPICPLGRSGTSTSHLHLNTIPDNQTGWNNIHNKNPLEYVEYVPPKYNIQIFSQPDTNAFNMTYPGTNTTPLCVRPRMDPITISGADNNRYSRINDVNQVEILLKKASETQFTKIKGAQMESILSLGGRIGTDVINHTRQQYASGQWGNWNRSGVDSYAYNSSNPHPYDDYYFSDFYTRIHKDHSFGTLRRTAELPANARYPDGEYALFAKVTNIRGQSTSSDTLSFTLDNFKPYVKRVEVSQSTFYNSGSPIYIAEWEEYWQPTDWSGVGKLFFSVHQADPIQRKYIGQIKRKAIHLSCPHLAQDRTCRIIKS